MIVAADLLRSDQIVLDWLDDTKDAMALIGGIMSIVQPDLYRRGREAIQELAYNCHNLVPTHVEQLLDVLELWWCPFNALTVVSNRDTPLHQDLGG